MTARQILDRLVAFPTVSRDSNLDLIAWVEAYLASYGVTSERVWNEDRTKAALFANVGPGLPGGVILSGHSDVVPVDGQDWTSDPWTVTEREGRLYGRGTCDMKGFLALALAAVPKALAAGVKRPLQLAISYDEEVGCTGAPPMIARIVEALPRAAAVVVGEPSRMRLVNGHKGGTGFRVHVKGFEVHSSLLPTGVSAIMEAARLVTWVNDQNAAIMAATPGTMAALFHPPHTTLHVGRIEGGTAHNITAADCRFLMESRVVPGESAEGWAQAFEAEAARLDADLKARRPGAGVTVERFFNVPALTPETDGAAEALVRRLTGDNGSDVVSYGTEAGHFQAVGLSCVVCGPGDIAQAHQADEYLELSEFQAGERFMDALIRELAA
ncbi:acetylornithine deacetylase [Tabrizicola sp. DMG-N-6]|uniref:Acetylornithine deacetylase n=2 Tax=Szabonella alba TaxID=2804194 RepID=A0A8K0XZT8_9RHOB|nr:acetylornithine deacetylase [Szabonella alba]